MFTIQKKITSLAAIFKFWIKYFRCQVKIRDEVHCF